MPDLVPGVGASTAVADAGAGGEGGQGGSGEVAPGGGAPDGGAAGGGAEGGAPGAIEEGAPAEGEGEPEQLELEETPESDVDPELEGVETDGRKLDLKTREALARFKKTNPEDAKRLAGTYFRAQTIVKEVGATNLSDAIVKVRNMAATLEGLGGEEGIQGLQSEVGDYRAEIQKFAEGDVAFLEELNESGPAAFTTAISNGLEILRGKNPEGFDKALFPSLVDRLEKSGIYRTIPALAALIKDGKGQESYDLVQEIAKWLGDAKAFADKQKVQRTERNPEKEKLDLRQKELDQRERQNYEGNVSSDVNRRNNTVTARQVEPFFKELGLKPEGRRKFVAALNSDIYEAMKQDKGFQRTANALMEKGDAGKAAQFIAAKFAELLPTHFRLLRNAMYPSYKPKAAKIAVAKTGAGGNGAAAGAGKGAAGGAAAVAGLVTVKPRPDEIDWTKTTDDMYHIGRGLGEAVLKNGKRVKWDWAKI
jgi:hypothetical protein